MASIHKRKWETFRSEIIELDEGKCVRCGKSRDDGAVLHVHHKAYVSGRAYWDYPADMRETLCAGCHAKHHGIISPDFGWVLESDDDLGGLLGTCDYCGTSLRYRYRVTHPNWPTMDIGCDCCDLLTQTKEASEREKHRHNRLERRRRFIESSKWQRDDGDALAIYAMGYRICIQLEAAGYRISFGIYKGGKHHPTVDTAKLAAFDAIESGKLREWITKKGRTQREGS